MTQESLEGDTGRGSLGTEGRVGRVSSRRGRVLEVGRDVPEYDLAETLEKGKKDTTDTAPPETLRDSRFPGSEAPRERREGPTRRTIQGPCERPRRRPSRTTT